MKRILLSLSFFVLIVCNAYGQEKWDLRRCVDYALEHNISVKQQDIQARIAELTYKQSKLSIYPSLNFSTSAGIRTGRSIDPTTNLYTNQDIFNNSFGLQTGVDLFNFGSKRNTISANRFAFEASIASVDKLKDDISLNVAGTYLQILLNKEQLVIDSLRVMQTSAQLTNTRKQVQAGTIPELNALQLEAVLAQDSANLITAKGTLTQSLLLLKALLDLDAATPFDVLTPPVELIPVEPISALQPEDVYQLALKNLPQQRVNDLLLKAAQKNADAVKGSMYPNLTLGASIQTNYSNAQNPHLISNTPIIDTIGRVVNSNTAVIAPGFDTKYSIYSDPYFNQFSNNFGRSVGFTLNVPIFNGNFARTNWEKAKLNVQNYQLQQQQSDLTLKQDIYKAYTDALTSLQSFHAATKTVAAAEKAFEFATKRWNVGLLNTLDLITTENNLYTARQQRLLAQYNYVFKMKVLEFYRGQGLKL
jgi:outer membrane protein